MFRKFVNDFEELYESEKERINDELKEMGAETLLLQLVDAAYLMITYERDRNKRRWPNNAKEYRKLIKKVVRKASYKLMAGKNRIK